MTKLDNNSHLHPSHLPGTRHRYQRYQHDAVVTTGSFSLDGGELGQKTDSSVSLSFQQAVVVTKEPIDAHKECAASREQISRAQQSVSNRIIGAIPLLLNNSKPSQYGDDRKSYRQTRNKQNRLPSHRTSFHSGTRRHFVSRWRKLAGRLSGLSYSNRGGSASVDPAKPAGGSWPPPAPTCGESLKS